jgi:hypothetical protein
MFYNTRAAARRAAALQRSHSAGDVPDQAGPSGVQAAATASPVQLNLHDNLLFEGTPASQTRPAVVNAPPAPQRRDPPARDPQVTVSLDTLSDSRDVFEDAVPGVVSTNSKVKVDMPKLFDATDRQYTVDKFVYAMGLYFLALGIYDSLQRVVLASTRLSGAPLDWFRSLVPDPSSLTPGPNSIMHNWSLFCSLLKATFQPVSSAQQARNQLARLRQTKDMRSYISYFRDVCLKIPDLSASEKLARFKEGISDSRIRTELDLRNVTTFEQAVVIAERMAAVSENSRPRDTPRDNSRASRLNVMSSARSAPRSRAAVNNPGPSTSAGPSSAPAAPAIKPLSPSERSRLQALATPGPDGRFVKLTADDRQFLSSVGACFYCRQQGHTQANCPRKQQKAAQQAAPKA